MLPFRKFAAPICVALLAAVIVVGCGVLPNAPQTTVPTTAAQTSPGTISRTAAPASLLGTVTDVVGGLVKLVFKLLTIDGSIGGSLANGRWQVVVPPGAIDGTATIGVGVSDNSSSSCELQITPAYKNHFAVPAQLTVSCAGVPLDQLKNYSIFLYDPNTKTWSPVAGSTVNLTTKTVSAPLQHFSTYAVGSSGRASW